MNGDEILRIVDAIHRDKAIDQEIVFEGIEQAILSAARKHFSEEEDVRVVVDRETGEPSLTCDGAALEPELLGDLLGRISAQTAKQVMIQKIREAERDAHFEEFLELKSQLVNGVVTRVDRGTVIVNLGKVEAILPRGEQILKENYRVGDRVRAIVMDVRKAGSRIRVILSRTHPDFVRRLFEVEIPEINDGVIVLRSIAREAGHRSKVAVSSHDSAVDCVGACVGVRGARIRGIIEELNGERIDIVRWNDSLQVLVPNALQPAETEDVILCPMLGKVIVLVKAEHLSLAIGRRGQNVRLASKLVGWDISVITQDSLDEQLNKSIEAFSVVPEMTPELVEVLVSQGFFTFDDLSVIEPDDLAELGGLTPEQCDAIVEYADIEAEKIEQQEKLEREARRLRKEAEAAGLLPREDEVAESSVPEGTADAGESAPGESAPNESAAGEVNEAGADSAESSDSQESADQAESASSGEENSTGEGDGEVAAAGSGEPEAASDESGSEADEEAAEVKSADSPAAQPES